MVGEKKKHDKFIVHFVGGLLANRLERNKACCVLKNLSVGFGPKQRYSKFGLVAN